jgi:hypothetical protein
MSSNVGTIKAAILAKVAQIGSLYSSFDYQKGDPEGYPFATVVNLNGESTWGDSAGTTHRDIQKMRFAINIYQEREANLFGAQKAEMVATTVLDEIMTAFHADTTLSGAVLWQRPISWDTDDTIIDKVVRVMTIVIEATKEISTP